MPPLPVTSSRRIEMFADLQAMVLEKRPTFFYTLVMAKMILSTKEHSALVQLKRELEEGPLSESPLYKAIEREGVRI